MANTFDVIAAKVSAHEPLSALDGRELLASSDIISLGMLAEDARLARHGNRVTFLRVLHVDLGGAADLESVPVSAGEVRLEGKPASLDQTIAAVRAVAARAGTVPFSAFSLCDLDDVARRAGLALRVCLGRLKEAGLERVADVSLDGQTDFERLLDSAAQSDVVVQRAVFDSAHDDWIERLQRFVRLENSRPLIKVLAPLARGLNRTAPTTGYQDLKKVSVARLLAGNIDTIQVDWSWYGPKLAQVALTFGADDLDSVSATDDGAVGPRRTPLEEVRRNIRAAGLVPVERDARWHVVTS